ncbi:hypothetical protein EV646_107143 [Kribbella antiqua]|uniref:Uncharacterized protein n=1 Tax=Kribbella antiqua TaxID=2512217 RepID=A0A4R2INI2_9ACTN|nr:hypothetical protein [Kribbella antiqua]TCO46122.1 hypothetical protein EV646_107143 [Kribbella antiqua]
MPPQLLWTLKNTDVTTDGSSGPIDPTQVDSLWLAVTVVRPPGKMGQHGAWFDIRLEVQDAGGVWIPVLYLLPGLDADGRGLAYGSIGPSLPASNNNRVSTVPMVLPAQARITWSVKTTPTIFGDTTITLYGR